MKKHSLVKSLFPLIKYIVLFNLMVVGLLVAKLFLWDVPSLKTHNPERTALMGIRGTDVRQTWVPLARIAPALARGIVAAEDARFYEHAGIDVEELKNSWRRNQREGDYARGGSTIPMQLAKNLFLTPDKNLFRKGLEVLIALKMTWDLPKERILEIYLNVIEWGDGIYGAEAASRHYFKKSAAQLNSYEAAFLVAIVPSPLEWGRMPPGPYVRSRIRTIQARMFSAPAPNLKNLQRFPVQPATPSAPAEHVAREQKQPARPSAPQRSVQAAAQVKSFPAQPAVLPSQAPAEAEQPAVVRPPASVTVSAPEAQTASPAAPDAEAAPQAAEPQTPDQFFLDDV